MKVKRILAGLLTLTLCAGLTACNSAAESGGEAAVQSVAMLMGVELSGNNQYNGVIEARSTEKIQKDGNKTVKECYVSVGDQVKEGDKLFSYDTDALELTVSSAELEVEQIRNSITNYETQIKSLEKDKKEAPSSDKLSYTLQIQETELSKAEAEYNLKQKEAELQKMKDSAGETEVVSPVSGVVQSIQKDSDDSSGMGGYGNGGDSGSDAYITIMETGTYRVRGSASEESIRSINEGVEITAYSRTDPTQSWHGTVSSVNTSAAESQQSENGNYYDGSGGESSSKYSFYVELDNSDGLLIGQHVYLKPGAADESGDEIVLPSGYLMLDGDNASVWAANSKDKLEKRSVTLGEYREASDEYVIAGGITLQDYIAYPDETMKEGMRVVRYDEASFGGDSGEYAQGEGEGGAFPEGEVPEGAFETGEVPEGVYAEGGFAEGEMPEGAFVEGEAVNDAEAGAEG